MSTYNRVSSGNPFPATSKAVKLYKVARRQPMDDTRKRSGVLENFLQTGEISKTQRQVLRFDVYEFREQLKADGPFDIRHCGLVEEQQEDTSRQCYIRNTLLYAHGSMTDQDDLTRFHRGD